MILFVRIILAVSLIAFAAFLLLPIATLLFALVTQYRLCRQRSYSNGRGINWYRYRTSLYSGRVRHTRFLPLKHSFHYPLFFCCLDLSEIDDLFGEQRSPVKAIAGNGALWPLSLLMNFREADHLKNGEGMGENVEEAKDLSSCSRRMADRVLRLVCSRTRGKVEPKSDCYRIFLLTHLSYYGYCFNPVSFYYIFKKREQHFAEKRKEEITHEHIEAIVAEVSNTPWNEMRCYVLHPDSVDTNNVHRRRDSKGCSINYIFDKKFHVSPFMTMDHTYDWTFWVQLENHVNGIVPRSIAVSTDLIKKNANIQNGSRKDDRFSINDDDAKFFNAYFHVHRQTFRPLSLCFQLIRLPVYCLIVQFWIHLEALVLFVKGVEFIEHPDGSETKASRWIGLFMTPFFAIKSWSHQFRTRSQHGKRRQFTKERDENIQRKLA